MPTYFKYNIFEIKTNNFYEINEKNENNIMQSNICIPHPSISPIPFTFGFINKNKYKLVNSNIYYYEVKLEESNYTYNDSLLSVGYGSINNLVIKHHVGDQDNSVGLHSSSGRVFINKSKNGILIANKIKNGDVIGAGLIYLKNDYYIPFFTLNGKLLKFVREVILTGLLTPQMSCRKINGINVNFSHNKFKFNIGKLINSYNNIISTKNKYILKNYDIKLYKFITRRLIMYIFLIKLSLCIFKFLLLI